MSATSIAERVERELLYEIVYVLKEGSIEECIEACKKLPGLQNKAAARDEFIPLLNLGGEVGGWAASALAALYDKGDNTARKAIAECLDVEEDERTRYWMLRALHKLGSRKQIEGVVRKIGQGFREAMTSEPSIGLQNVDLQNIDADYLDQAQRLRLVLVRDRRAGPLALTILTSWGDREAAEALEHMLQSGIFEQMWDALRALEEVSLREMLEPLLKVAQDLTMWPDIRFKAVKAIGRIKSPAAARALGQVLAYAQDASIKEMAILGMEQLGTSLEVRAMLAQLQKAGEAPYPMSASLMGLLMDENAQIRSRAAETLPYVMLDAKAYAEGDEAAQARALKEGRMAAAEEVVRELVREHVDLDKGVPQLVNALRVIDPPEAEAAATVLTKYLYSDDVSVRKRAERALKLVGGEKAVQTLMGQKSEVLRAYNELLEKADEPIQDLFRDTMRQAQRSFGISQGMSIAIFVIGLGALIAGLYMAFTAGQVGIEFVFGAGTSIVAVIAVLLDLLLLDPHKRVQEATSVLLRIKVIFLGYVRQVHQIDATFKHEFIEGGREFGAEDVRETVKQINEVMSNTMDMITTHLPVRKTERRKVDEVLKSWQERLDAALHAVERAQPPAGEGTEGGVTEEDDVKGVDEEPKPG